MKPRKPARDAAQSSATISRRYGEHLTTLTLYKASYRLCLSRGRRTWEIACDWPMPMPELVAWIERTTATE